MTLLLLTFAVTAWAEWVKYAESATDGTSFYYDPATIKKRGDKVRVWLISDLKERRKDDELSYRILYEFDCTQKRRRILLHIAHSGQMAGGKVLESHNTPTEWGGSSEPGTVIDTMLKIVCNPAPAKVNWVKYEESDKGNSVYYDPATIKKDGDIVRVWRVSDFKARDKDTGVWSVRSLDEYDCKERRTRTLTATAHSGQRLSGKVLGSQEGQSEWYHIPPGTVGVAMLEIVCK